MFRIINFLVLFVCLFTLNVFADVVFEMEEKGEFTGEIDKTIGSVKGNKIKMDYFTNGNNKESSMIYDGNKKEMITISHTEKAYQVMDEQTISKMAGQMNQAMAQMEAAMKDLSPKEREMMKQMMKGKMPHMQESSYIEPVIKKSGSGSVKGLSCTKYDIYKGSTKVRNHCVTKWSNIDGGDEIYGAMTSMSEFFDNMMKAYSKGPFGSQVQFEKNVFNQLKKLNGFPIYTVNYENGKIEYESTLKSSKKTSVDSGIFNPPSGYKKQTIDFN